MPNRAIGYVRVSTAEQVESGLSLVSQRARIEAYCAAHGLNLIHIIEDDGISAGKEFHTRPGGQCAISMLKQASANNIIATKLDRMFRDAADALIQSRKWDDSGIGLHLIDMDGSGQSINTRSALGRFFFTISAGYAELERRNAIERTRDALAVKRGRGEKTGGHRPFGAVVGRDGALLPHEAEVSAYHEIIRLTNAGRKPAQIVELLDIEVSESTVRRVLKRGLPVYAVTAQAME